MGKIVLLRTDSITLYSPRSLDITVGTVFCNKNES